MTPRLALAKIEKTAVTAARDLAAGWMLATAVACVVCQALPGVLSVLLMAGGPGGEAVVSVELYSCMCDHRRRKGAGLVLVLSLTYVADQDREERGACI
ncbi:hypothetical protein A4R35_20140 [Thermogemmatispora tikiterensis]|uniref:Uncharacterized protein n=1 Tax=Thermogemmatispora tikiterensis TaxID=1825093 RepID=A0A328VLY3_9CHLR|nr:hypothetical protein A4R35_20140 [Thermogemmatispora tikiterensis]